MHIIVFRLDGKIYKWSSPEFDVGFFISCFIYINDVQKIKDNDDQVVLFADDTSIIVTTCNVEGATDGRIKLNGSARNGSKLKSVQYVDI